MCVSWRPHINLTLPDTEVRSISVRFFLARLIQRAAEHMWSSSLSIWASLTFFFWGTSIQTLYSWWQTQPNSRSCGHQSCSGKGVQEGTMASALSLICFASSFLKSFSLGWTSTHCIPSTSCCKNSDLKRSQHISLLIMLTGVFISCISCILYLQWGDAGGGHVTSQS